MSTKPISQKVSFRTINASALVNQLEGPEQPYPVYEFANKAKMERPVRPNQPYRWVEDNE